MEDWKDWHKILFGVFSGLIAAAVLLVFSNQPHGKSIELPPLPSPVPYQIYISGEVIHPGVYQLPVGSRVQQAIDSSGGLTENADIEAINLAARLTDGSRIDIPRIGEKPVEIVRGGEVMGLLIDINTATLEELMTLPGIGEDKASQIIQYREEQGRFITIEEIQKIKGIGPVTFENIKSLIMVAP